MTHVDCFLDRRQAMRAFAATLAGAVWLRTDAALKADEVSWLAEVQRPPEHVPRERIGELQPLLKDDDGQAIRTLKDWQSQRETIRRAWLEFLGPMPADRPPVQLTVLDEERFEGGRRQLVRYLSEPAVPVEGYLLRPDGPGSGKRPGIVALHATTNATIDRIAGLTGPENRQLGLKLCRREFVVFCPRNFLWQDVSNYEEAVRRFRQRHPETRGMRKMLYDARRAVDVLQSLDDVDPQRIGAIGHSLGAKETLYLAAFDERVKAGVASEGGLGFRFTNWDAPWYLGPEIHKPGFELNHHQLLALIAPRPFLIVAGESGRGAADGDRTWPFVEAALPVYRLYGRPARLGLYNHRRGHTIPAEAFRRMAQWLRTYLKGD